MTQTFTLNQNDVIRYIYNETTPKENERITETLLYDSELLDFYMDALDLKAGFDEVIMAPPTFVTDNIMAYSRKYLPETV